MIVAQPSINSTHVSTTKPFFRIIIPHVRKSPLAAGIPAETKNDDAILQSACACDLTGDQICSKEIRIILDEKVDLADEVSKRSEAAWTGDRGEIRGCAFYSSVIMPFGNNLPIRRLFRRHSYLHENGRESNFL
ncbi:MAG TPA: hypothetical protein VHJ19_04670 [Gammaproteobacteria bacterium]|nr:hypothetical protein [Gammaproteobacteria bacterium]